MNPFTWLYRTFYLDRNNLRLLLGFSTLIGTVSTIGVDQLTLTFIICMISLGAISTAISSKVYLYLQRQNPGHFQEDIRTELPAILAYYQSVHQAKKGQKNLNVPLLEEVSINKVPSPMVRRSWRKKALINRKFRKKVVHQNYAKSIGATRFLVSESAKSMRVAKAE